MKTITHLTTSQASQRLAVHGPNVLTEATSHSPLSIFIGQFANILVIMLIAAAILSLILGDALDGILIVTILILNALLGFVQEYKAEKALSALKQMTVSVVKVLRDGSVQELPSSRLVPDDIILLEEGDKVPADATILESVHVEINEAALTGESLPVEKNTTTDSGIYMGTIVTHGRATARVTATGMRTKFGSIATKLSAIQDEETPLEKKMDILGKQLGVVALCASGTIFALGFLRHDPIFASILTAISLAVAAVPEGLPAVVTITLAVGTQRMAKQRSILRKLSAIESLGSVTVIATDKTGTLTQNDMKVTDIWIDGTAYKPDTIGKTIPPYIKALVETGVLCNNASLSATKGGKTTSVVGDKTEGSLLLLAHDLHIPVDDTRNDGELVEEFAFTSERKMMTVVWKKDKGHRIHAKGAPEAILRICNQFHTTRGDVTLTATKRAEIEAAFRAFAARGLRMIAFATEDIAWKQQKREHVESDLVFLGFVGISDPVRPAIAQAVEKAHKAGIISIMITGDNELTAQAVAEDIGILKAGERVMTGPQLAALTDQEAKQALSNTRVFARTTPEQKYHIVTLLQQIGHVVAVTGDGVNDALALKQADVGVAMGMTGTDVAKEAADMIITDDNYASLVVAIEEGRTIFDNIKSATKYLIGCNLGEIGAITGGVLLGWPFILSPLHILYVNLATDGLPAIGLALTPKQGDIMTHKPRTEKTIFNKHDFLWFIEVGVLTTLATLVSFIIGSQYNVTLGRTLAFLAIILAQQYIFYDVASRNNTIMKLSFRNFPWALLPVAIIVIQILLLELPFFEKIFTLEAPPIMFSIMSVGITSALLIVSELRKKYGRHLYYHH